MADELYNYFHPHDRCVLKGSASFNQPADGFSKEGSLYLKPGIDQLTDQDLDIAALDVLRDYLATFQPSFKTYPGEGRLFLGRDGEFSLHRHDGGLSFFVYDPGPWRPSDKVMVLSKQYFNERELKLNIIALDREASFVHGTLDTLVDHEDFLIMRRYYPE